MMKPLLMCIAWLLLLLVTNIAAANTPAPMLMRQVDVRQDTLVFTYGQDIWQASLTSKQAFRLTSFRGQAQSPKISPDGKWIAFSAQLNGNFDVYLIATGGGEIIQLTWHPEDDFVRGWSPDSSKILFASARSSAPVKLPQFYTVRLDGGTPEPLPMSRAQSGSFSPQGDRIVYQKITPWDDGWRNYRGGQNQPLRLVDLDTLEESSLPWNREKQIQPVWHQGYIYFLSDADGVMNVYRFAETSQDNSSARQLTFFNDYDVKSFGVWSGTLLVEQHGRLYQQSINAEKSAPVPLSITLHGDFPWTRQQWVKAAEHIESASISPSGKRALFVARGEVFSVPAEHGEERNLSNSWQREVDAQWSPDAKQIAWFSDRSGEYTLMLSDQFGQHLRTIPLRGTGFYKNLRWSPDSKKIAFTDQRQSIWLLTIASQALHRIDQDTQVIPSDLHPPAWSPDSAYLAYGKTSDNFLHDVYVFELATQTSYLITDGMADNPSFAWDHKGHYLYLNASVDFASMAPWLDLSTTGKAQENYQVYAVILQKHGKSPLQLQRDTEPVKASAEADEEADEDSEDKERSELKVQIDFTGIQSRMIALPVGSGHFSRLNSSEAGLLMVKKENEEQSNLYLFDFEQQQSQLLIKGIKHYAVAANNQAILVQQGSLWKMADDIHSIKDAPGLNVQLPLYLDPKQEWRQKFREAWRYQRDYFYVANLHGVNWQQIWRDYSPLLTGVNHLADLNYLLDNLGAETSVGHSFNGGGEFPELPASQIGLLGIDVGTDSDNFIIKRVYSGEAWNGEINRYAPFANVHHQLAVNDRIIAVNDQKLSTRENFYRYFNGTLNKQTKITIRSARTGDSTDYWVIPIEDESKLRQMAWVEDNRRFVNQASDNQLAYVWLPDTGDKGYRYFNRYFFAQADRKGIIVDERFNGGGYIADYMIDVLGRKLSGYFNNILDSQRPLTSPGAIINGPKVLLINEMAGSGGDMFPYLFRFHNLGTIIGTRTWGGLVGIWGVPSFVDGGYMTAPRSGFYDLTGNWAVENKGVAPDISVDDDLLLSSQGKDAQLQRAVQEALKQLETYQERRRLPAPPDPVRAIQVDNN
ncbi:S41 family peptidase [Thalassotalea mangrovi]|nr:S41 family peptidase [Thalassotalea mangrovi]